MRLQKTSRRPLIVTSSVIIVAITLCGVGGYMFITYDSTKKTDAILPSRTNRGDESKVSNQTVAPKNQTSPGSLLNLKNWKIALPIDTAHAGTPDEIKQPEITNFTDSNSFFLNSARDGVVFRARADGATTKNSSYPRSELREMTDEGTENASWSTSKGFHTMTIRQAITHLPDVKSELVSAQIHDEDDDVVMVRLEKNHLFVESDGENIGTLDEEYILGTIYEVRIEVQDGRIEVYYNGVLKVDIKKTGTGYYFKAGCYTQTNTTKGDPATSYGEVVIYDLAVKHS